MRSSWDVDATTRLATKSSKPRRLPFSSFLLLKPTGGASEHQMCIRDRCCADATGCHYEFRPGTAVPGHPYRAGAFLQSRDQVEPRASEWIAQPGSVKPAAYVAAAVDKSIVLRSGAATNFKPPVCSSDSKERTVIRPSFWVPS